MNTESPTLEQRIDSTVRKHLLTAGIIKEMSAPIIPEFLDEDLHHTLFVDIGRAVAKLLPMSYEPEAEPPVGVSAPERPGLRYATGWGFSSIGTREQLAAANYEMFKDWYRNPGDLDKDLEFEGIGDFIVHVLEDETRPLSLDSEDDLFIIGYNAVFEPGAFIGGKDERIE